MSTISGLTSGKRSNYSRDWSSGRYSYGPKNPRSLTASDRSEPESLILQSYFYQNQIKLQADFQKRKKRDVKAKTTVLLMNAAADIEVYHPQSMQHEVRDFCLYGNLKPADTEVHNPLPSSDLIDREKQYNEFENHRRAHPDAVMYKKFYRYLTPKLSSNYPVIPPSITSSQHSSARREPS